MGTEAMDVDPFRKGLGISLAMAQFILAASLFLSTSMPPAGIVTWCLLSAGAGVAVWAWFTMGLLKIRVTPAPGRGAVLVDRGPYAVIRHPMYSGLLVACGGLLLHDFRLWRLLVWVALATVLAVKAAVEERILLRDLPGYDAYRERTSAFFPGL